MGGTIFIVRQDKLEGTPEGFQRYVKAHFKERVLVGVPVFTASTRNWDHDDYDLYQRRPDNLCGIAPTPNWAGKTYELGFAEGERLGSWIDKHPEIVEKLYAVGEKEAFIDDD